MIFPQPQVDVAVLFPAEARPYHRHKSVTASGRRPPMFVRNAWYIGAWADELGAQPLARRICNEPVVLFRDAAGKAAALADRCCHRAAPLSMGKVVEDGLECGYHGLTFDGSGRCVRIPGQRQIPAEA